MASISAPRLLTAEEYGKLEDVPGFRDELIEGERVLSPSPVFQHAAVIKHLERILEDQLAELSPEPLYLARETGWKFHNPASGADSVPIPDLMVIRKEDARHAIKTGRWFERTPLFVIEVVSPSERKAYRLQKVGLYLDMGVPFVVEVDYKKRLVLVYTPNADAAAVYHKADQVTTPFRSSVDQIFSVLD